MGDAGDMQDPMAEGRSDDGASEAADDELREIRDLHNMRAFLSAENLRLKRQAEILAGELEGIAITISSSEAQTASYERRKKAVSEGLGKYESIRESVVQEINGLHLRIKAACLDEASSLKLKENLAAELAELEIQKAGVTKRIKEIQAGLRQLSSDKEKKVPNLEWYDAILKQIHAVFMETQHRMDVSLIMKRR